MRSLNQRVLSEGQVLQMGTQNTGADGVMATGILESCGVLQSSVPLCTIHTCNAHVYLDTHTNTLAHTCMGGYQMVHLGEIDWLRVTWQTHL